MRRPRAVRHAVRMFDACFTVSAAGVAPGVHADGVNLYDDLYAGEEGAAVLQERVDGLERTCAKQRKELGDARAELTRIQAENEALRKDRETLLKNISSVYLTGEIGHCTVIPDPLSPRLGSSGNG